LSRDLRFVGLKLGLKFGVENLKKLNEERGPFKSFTLHTSHKHSKTGEKELI
jgi:hypothetical protein